MKLSREELRNTEIICVCTKSKAVCERVLVDGGILVSGNNQRLRDLSFGERYKLDQNYGGFIWVQCKLVIR